MEGSRLGLIGREAPGPHEGGAWGLLHVEIPLILPCQVPAIPGSVAS